LVIFKKKVKAGNYARLLVDLPEHGIHKGAIGQVVSVFKIDKQYATFMPDDQPEGKERMFVILAKHLKVISKEALFKH